MNLSGKKSTQVAPHSSAKDAGHNFGHNFGRDEMRLSLEEVLAATQGRTLSQFERVFHGVGTDTRSSLEGQLFVALRGDSYDAHLFLKNAANAGASALLIHEFPKEMSEPEREELKQRVTIIEVKDTLKGLQALANHWRHKMPAKILGITGTNGKTTTKEFVAAILGSKLSVQYSKGSFNNHWGVPISLLSITPAHQVAVIEMGLNHAGELRTLSQIAEPDTVVCTMVGRGHLEGLGTIEGVARAKSEIYEMAPAASSRIFNLENFYTRAMMQKFAPHLPDDQILTFAGCDSAKLPEIQNALAQSPRGESFGGTTQRELDVQLKVISVESDALVIRGSIRGKEGEARVPVFGQHNITNLMAAAALALSCQMTPEEIWEALPLCRTAWGRNQWVKLESGARALFDAYNANPESMLAAVSNFSELRAQGSRKFAVLGEMREMGDAAPLVHRELGEAVARAGFAGVLFIGPSAKDFASGLAAQGYSNTSVISDTYENELAARLVPVLHPTDIVLVKGSRGMQLERVLNDLKPLDFAPKK